jgi:probable phosphoglycerate mutase
MPLWLLRHAHTEWNGPPRRLQGRTDIGLSEEGRRAARELGSSLPRPHRVVASPARRCRETIAALFGADPPPEVFDSRLWEIDLGYFAGLTEAEAAEAYPAEWRAWLRRPSAVRPGGGETLAEMQARVLAMFDTVEAAVESPDLTLVVTHGGAIRVLDCHLSGRSLDDWHAMPIANLARYHVAGPVTGRRLVPLV